MKAHSLLFYALFLLFAFAAKGLRLEGATYENEERTSEEGNLVTQERMTSSFLE